MDIEIAGGAYQYDIGDINPQRCVNWYPKYSTKIEANKETPQNRHLYPRPGLKPYISLGGDRVRALYVHNDVAYAVVGTELWSIDLAGNTTDIGTLTNLQDGVDRVYIESGGNDTLMIAREDIAYSYDINADTITQVTDVDYPGCDYLTYVDGYFVVTRNGRVYFSELNDETNWVGNSVFTPTEKADKTKAVIAFNQQLYCFGTRTVEIYINDGETPWIRQPRATIEMGIAAKDTLAHHQDGVFFLGRNAQGGSRVMIIGKDYSTAEISPPSINMQINKNGIPTDAYAFFEYDYSGQSFYHLTIPSLDTTFTYDLITKEWHERQSRRPWNDFDGGYVYGKWRPYNLVTLGSKTLVGDYYSGDVYELDKNTYTDDGYEIVRLRTTKIFDQMQNFIGVSSLELDVNSGDGLLSGQGSSPQLMFRASKDGGRTWSNESLISLGTRGDYSKRAKINKLGTGRNWVFEMKVTDPVPIIITNAVAHGSVSST